MSIWFNYMAACYVTGIYATSFYAMATVPASLLLKVR